MRGPNPKPAALRQRTNKHSTAATLPSEAESRKRKVPPLPDRESKAEVWHPGVTRWWASIWKSPMAAEYLDSDVKGALYNCAELYQRRYTETDTKILLAIITAIGKLEEKFGGSPIDRRRLQWSIEQGEQAEERTTKRRKSRKLDHVEKQNPRDVLKVVQ